MGKRRLRWRSGMQRVGSTWIVGALGVLVVLGLSALVVGNVRGARDAERGARMAEAAAVVTGDAIHLFNALQIERGSAALLGAQRTESAAVRYEAAVATTDEAIDELREAWAQARERLAEMSPPTVADVLSATRSLGEIRAAASQPEGESTFDLYVSIVDTLLGATQSLGGVSANGDQVPEGNALGALLRATESLGRERALVAEVLAGEAELTGEEAVRLFLLERDFQVNARAAQALLAGDASEEIAAVVSGPAAVEADALLRDLELGGGTARAADPLAWFELATGRIDALTAVAAGVNVDLRERAAGDLRQARQALLVRSVGLGALLLIAIAAAGSAIFASVERVRALDEYAELAGGLQRWFLPETLSDVAGLRMAARYLPASERTRAGGDWYDTYRLGPRRVALVIGDVAGHGPLAGAQMAEVRNLLRGQSIAYPQAPGRQVELLENTLDGSPTFATVVFAVLDLDEGTLTYSRAGHVPPLLAGPDGQVTVLDSGTGPPVGTGGGTRDRPDSRVAVAPGSVLVLYTDGLVESRRHDIEEGIGALVAAFPGPAGDLEAIADQVLASRPDTANEDDIAMLLVRWEEPPPPAAP